MSQKRCSSCGFWNDGSLELCVSCGEMLDFREQEQVRFKKSGKLPVHVEESGMFEIKPEYPMWRKVILYIVRPFYWLFMIIAGFFVWLAVWASA